MYTTTDSCETQAQSGYLSVVVTP
ncbi:MAG: hypothetical protein J07HX64_01482 [halophilic archaeon J07HX64]|nr:MAG: hypothetical protein J07HX64_01482 [halophilic archaeon J07HX64]